MCFFWFCSRSGVMCSRLILVSRAAYRNTASLFLIETSGVWELTEWSLSHHCLSPPHYREALWPLFSPIIHARAPSPALWLCHSYPIIPKSLPSHRTSKAASLLPNIRLGFIYDLWAIDTDRRVFFVHPGSDVHMHPKQDERPRALWHCEKTGNQHHASRHTKIQTPRHYANRSFWLVLTWLYTTLLISIIRYSNGCWGRSMQFEQNRENS